MRKKKILNLWYQALLRTLHSNGEEVAMTKSSSIDIHGSIARTADSLVDNMTRTVPYPGSNIDNERNYFGSDLKTEYRGIQS